MHSRLRSESSGVRYSRLAPKTSENTFLGSVFPLCLQFLQLASLFNQRKLKQTNKK